MEAARQVLTERTCADLASLIIDYETSYCLECDDQSYTVTKDEFKLKFVNQDVLEIDFTPKPKAKCWVTLAYPYRFPEPALFTLDVYDTKNKDNHEDKRNNWFSINLPCTECMPRVDIPRDETKIVKHSFVYNRDTPRQGHITWNIKNLDNRKVEYHLMNCVWSFSIHDYHKSPIITCVDDDDD